MDLVDERPLDHLDADPSDATGQIEYELHGWALESRVMLQQLLSASQVPHAWEAEDLVIPAAFEARVDAMLEQVEVTTLPTLDPDATKVAYDIDGWNDERQTLLMHELDEVGIAYEFDEGGALIVVEDDELRVDAVLDRLEETNWAATGVDAVATGADGDVSDEHDDDGDDAGDGDEDDEDAGDDADDADEADEDYDGPEAMDVMSDLFDAADRLMHSATDAEGVLTLVARATDAARMPLPYGFSRPVWRDILAQVTNLKALIENDEIDDDAIEDHARELRATLRTYV